MNFRFHRAALAEHLDQVVFYESQLAGLGADYLAEFDALMHRICSQPQSYAPISSAGLRKAGMRRFPFHVVYMEHESQIFILALAHHRRRPTYWVERIGD